MAAGRPNALFTLGADQPFLPALAAGLWQMAEHDPLKLSGMRLFLPTRRACRLLREQFVPVTGLKAMLLPQMQPLGDMGAADDGENALADPDLAVRLADIPPAITPLRRQLLLAQQIMRRDATLGNDQAYALAGALATLIDEVQTAGQDFSALPRLISDDGLAYHWQETLRFLDIVTQYWPAILADEGCLDPVEHRRRVSGTYIVHWQKKPPEVPIIAAGSTGSVPATADFLRAIMALPQGYVVLPGLDVLMDEASWQAIDEQHPQHAMKNFLQHCDIKHANVRLWPDQSQAHNLSDTPRALLLREVMRPAAVTEVWRALTPEQLPRDALSCIERLTLDHAQEEAAVIALRLRAALEDPQKTALLVTADRALAERVSAMLARWSIVVDDSAGQSLARMPVGVYLLLLLAAADTKDAVALLSLLKHPLTACGLETVDCRTAARQLERQTWRADVEPQPEQLQFLAKYLGPLHENATARPLTDWLTLHRQVAEQVTTTPNIAGATRLWRGDDGLAAAAWFDAAQMAAKDYPALTLQQYRQLCARLIAETPCRARFGQHPRLTILGTLEARLAHADLVIIGGLNEGVWPPAPPVDPWMSRPMKQQFGLLSPELRVGLSAHDFVQLAASGQVLMTRAKRAGQTPTVPSRFWLQMDAVLQAAGYDDVALHDPLTPELPWRDWAAALDTPDGLQTPTTPPEPRPPVEVRPQSLSVTRVTTWLRNPYALYAEKILRLKKLEPLQKEWEASDRGNLFHKILEEFIKANRTALPDHAQAALASVAERVFDAARLPEDIRLFWWPRFQSMARWFVKQEGAHRAEEYRPCLVEEEGRIEIRTISGHSFILMGRADRIDKNTDGHFAVIDYKTGSIPSAKEVESGLEPQLTLLSLILAEGGFGEAGQAAQLAYWPVTGTRGDKKVMAFPRDGKNAKSLEDLRTEAQAGLHHLVDVYADAATPYLAVPRPDIAPRYNDYAHLSRLLEWGRISGGDS